MLLIANPAAGNGHVGRAWDGILGEVRAVFPEVVGVLTTRPREATELAARAVRDGETAILSLGGDGTHSEVVAGIAEVSTDGSVSLGILHGGTGGDFSRLLGRGTITAQVERMRDLPAHPIDVGRLTWGDGAGSRVFLNEASIGIGGTLCARVNAGSKRGGATRTFLRATLRTFVSFRPQPLEVAIDDQTLRLGPSLAVIVCNGQYGGGGMRLAPRSRLADGAFEVLILDRIRALRVPRVLRRLYDGRLVEEPEGRYERGRRIAVRTLGEPFEIEADGEVVGLTPAVVEVLPGAIRLLGAPAAYL